MVNFSREPVSEEKGVRSAIPETIALHCMEPQLREQVEAWLQTLDNRTGAQRTLQDYVHGKEQVAVN